MTHHSPHSLCYCPQVGLLGLARSVQSELDEIADKADTSSPQGLHYVLQETVLALLRHPDYCVYGATRHATSCHVMCELMFSHSHAFSV
jgi:uncharacterized membrane protein